MSKAAEYAERLEEVVKDAVLRTVAEFKRRHPREHMNGYALLTDDGLGTLGHVACSKEFIASESEPDTLFLPVDWAYDDGVKAFDRQARPLLVSHADACEGGEFLAHIDDSFNALVSALMSLRGDGVFGADVFLSVGSTDPSDRLERLEENAVRALNSDAVYRAWKNTR